MSADIEAWPPPDDAKAFESLCLDLYREIWNDPSAQKNGRSGQPQAGVDVFGICNGEQAGVQCKQKNGLLRTRVTPTELEAEVEAAKEFLPPLKAFVIATTGPRDAPVQEKARLLTETHRQRGLFRVEVSSWNEIWPELYCRQELLDRVGPIYWPRLFSNYPSRRRTKRTILTTFAIVAIIAAVAAVLTNRRGVNKEPQLQLILNSPRFSAADLYLTNREMFQDVRSNVAIASWMLVLPILPSEEYATLRLSTHNSSESKSADGVVVTVTFPEDMVVSPETLAGPAGWGYVANPTPPYRGLANRVSDKLFPLVTQQFKDIGLKPRNGWANPPTQIPLAFHVSSDDGSSRIVLKLLCPVGDVPDAPHLIPPKSSFEIQASQMRCKLVLQSALNWTNCNVELTNGFLFQGGLSRIWSTEDWDGHLIVPIRDNQLNPSVIFGIVAEPVSKKELSEIVISVPRTVTWSLGNGWSETLLRSPGSQFKSAVAKLDSTRVSSSGSWSLPSITFDFATTRAPVPVPVHVLIDGAGIPTLMGFWLSFTADPEAKGYRPQVVSGKFGTPIQLK